MKPFLNIVLIILIVPIVYVVFFGFRMLNNILSIVSALIKVFLFTFELNFKMVLVHILEFFGMIFVSIIDIPLGLVVIIPFVLDEAISISSEIIFK